MNIVLRRSMLKTDLRLLTFLMRNRIVAGGNLNRHRLLLLLLQWPRVPVLKENSATLTVSTLSIPTVGDL